MDLYVRLAKPDVDALIELQHWLAHDDRFPAPGRQPQSVPPQSGSLGATTEILQLIVGNAIALGSLLVSIAQWRESRAQPPEIRISAHRLDGTTVTIQSSDPQAVAAAVRELGEP
jgi:hypothetical protein